MEVFRSVFLACLAAAFVLYPVGAPAESSNSASQPDASKKCSPVQPGRHEIHHLSSTATVSDGVSFATDWSHVHSGGWYGQQVMDRCRIQPDSFLTWHGKAAVRIEVQPNDDPLALNSNSERAEMLIMQDSNG